MGPAQRSLHGMFLDKAQADYLINCGLHERCANRLALTIALPKVRLRSLKGFAGIVPGQHNLTQTYRIGNVLTCDRERCIFFGGAVDADVYNLYPMRSLWRL